MEPIRTTFLGTSGSVPQKDKNFSAIVISFRGETILFDCPEGTQKQLMQSEHSLMSINKVFISHMHADHFLGLFGWISTMTLNQRKEKLTIYSPKGGKEKIQKIMKEVIRPSFPIEYIELKKGVIEKNDYFEIKAIPLKHEIPCYGFIFKENDKIGEFDRNKAIKLGIPVGPLFAKLAKGEKVKVNGKTFTQKDVMNYKKGRKGRRIAIIADTLPLKQIVKEINQVDLLIHEATFLDKQKDKAIEAMHSTALDAATIAKKAKAKKLALFHFSARNNDTNEILQEAKKEFNNTIIPSELETITI
ncbi:MAG: ribonuclease Z [Candidatus Iainarchaeum sp.]|jgi:ribonuclease Z|nr:MAG: Ribonuclease Z [archaeon ADurb.Bin336]